MTVCGIGTVSSHTKTESTCKLMCYNENLMLSYFLFTFRVLLYVVRRFGMQAMVTCSTNLNLLTKTR